MACLALASSSDFVELLGSSQGCCIPQSYRDTKNRSFAFDIKPGEDDVIVVTKENFDTCNSAEPLYQFRGPVYIKALTPGTYYFTCSFAGHCVKGQKVAILLNPLRTCCLVQVQVQAPPSSSASDESVAIEHLQI
ncbi:hypothetical protein ACLB2K_055167 [Fragaria x ananassa]